MDRQNSPMEISNPETLSLSLSNFLTALTVSESARVAH